MLFQNGKIIKPLHKLGVYEQLMPRLACQVLSSLVSKKICVKSQKILTVQAKSYDSDQPAHCQRMISFVPIHSTDSYTHDNNLVISKITC